MRFPYGKVMIKMGNAFTAGRERNVKITTKEPLAFRYRDIWTTKVTDTKVYMVETTGQYRGEKQ